MSEVLSQSQIDALLNAVRSGEKNLENDQDQSKEKKYRKYDFSSPRKFTKDRIKMLNSIFDSYTRLINTRLNALLHTTCEVEVESVEEQRYYEFSNALREGDVLALAQVDVKGKPEESPLLLYLSSNIALNMMDRMMGGEGEEVATETLSNYTYTDLELLLYENIVTDMISVMGGTWENYINITFTYDKTEVDPTLANFIGLDETVVIIDMHLRVPNCSGRLSVCLPAMMLTNIFAEINREKPGRKMQGEDKSDEIFDSLRDSDLLITAQLGETQMSLNDLYHLNVGDVIDIGRPKSSPIFLEIGGQPWFTGRMGTYKKNMAVKIDGVCYETEQRSE